MDDHSDPRSLFVAMYYVFEEEALLQPHFTILQLETPEQLAPERINNPIVVGPKVRFNERMDLPTVQWSASPPTTSTGDLYLLPNRGARHPLNGYNFNFSTGSFQLIPLPPTMKAGTIKCVVNLRGRIYRLEHHSYPDKSVFDCYDPENYSWKSLKPFPKGRFNSGIDATAVWGDTFLFNVHSSGIWAYDICRNDWYFVNIKDDRCYSIVGEAAVLKDTMYALSTNDVVLALSIEKEEIGGDLVFKCSVRSEILMPFLSRDEEEEEAAAAAPNVTTTHLVHLGKADFCLVQGCDPLLSNEDPKLIHVIYMELTGEGSMAVLSDHWFETRYDYPCKLVHCFSLPKCNTTELEEGKPFVFDLHPFAGKSLTSITIRGLRANVTVSQLEKGLKEFGSIRRKRVQINRNKKGNASAVVEFESVPSKLSAIKASTVKIGGCAATISEN